MDHLSIGADGGGAEGSVVIMRLAQFPYPDCAAIGRGSIGLLHILNPQRNMLYSIPVQHLVCRDFIGRAVGRSDDEANLA